MTNSRLKHCLIVHHIYPVRLFEDKTSCWREEQLTINFGMVPSKLLKLRSSCCNNNMFSIDNIIFLQVVVLLLLQLGSVCSCFEWWGHSKWHMFLRFLWIYGGLVSWAMYSFLFHIHIFSLIVRWLRVIFLAIIEKANL